MSVINELEKIYNEATANDNTNIAELKRLENDFLKLYHDNIKGISADERGYEVACWASDITLRRFRAENPNALRSRPSSPSEQISGEIRAQIAQEMKNALDEYKITLEKIRTKWLVEKNPRYEEAYEKTLAFTEKLAADIFLFQNGSTLDKFIEKYHAHFSDIQSELKQSRSHPTFRKYVSLPIERLKETINQIALKYHQWKIGSGPLNQDIIERPFFKQTKTSSSEHADTLERKFDEIVKKPRGV